MFLRLFPCFIEIRKGSLFFCVGILEPGGRLPSRKALEVRLFAPEGRRGVCACAYPDLIQEISSPDPEVLVQVH